MREEFTTAKNLLKLFELIAVLAIVAGLVMIAVTLNKPAPLVSVAAGLGLIGAGIVNLIVCQIGRAQIATATNTGRMLALMEEQDRVAHRQRQERAMSDLEAGATENSDTSASSSARRNYRYPRSTSRGAMPATVTAHGQSEFYKSFEITRVGSRCIVAGENFATLDQARSYVDSITD